MQSAGDGFRFQVKELGARESDLKQANVERIHPLSRLSSVLVLVLFRFACLRIRSSRSEVFRLVLFLALCQRRITGNKKHWLTLNS
jgi:hypothetical protein